VKDKKRQTEGERDEEKISVSDYLKKPFSATLMLATNILYVSTYSFLQSSLKFASKAGAYLILAS
jgi:hypothetical protein